MAGSRARTGAALVAVLMAAAGCSATPDVVVDGGPAEPQPATPHATTAVEPTPAPEATESPSPTPVVESRGPWPTERPIDFAFAFDQDGGSAPWSEDIDVVGERGTFTLWYEGLEYAIDYTPAPERLDAVYAEVANGRFDLYEAIPFADDEMIYDAEQQSWLAEAGEFRHRVSIGGNDIDRPDVPGAPLAAMSAFNDIDRVPAALVPLSIIVDPAAAETDLWGVDLYIDLTGSDLAVGDDRWTNDIELRLSQPLEGVKILLERSGGTAGILYFEGEVDLAPSSQIVIVLSPAGDPTIEIR